MVRALGTSLAAWSFAAVAWAKDGARCDNGRVVANLRDSRFEFPLWVAFVVALTYYFGVGGFPVGLFSQDSIGMASGARQIMEQGWDGPRIDYGRETRPGVFWVLILRVG